MPKFEVTVTYSKSSTYEIEAKDWFSAEDQAMDMFDHAVDGDWKSEIFELLPDGTRKSINVPPKPELCIIGLYRYGEFVGVLWAGYTHDKTKKRLEVLRKYVKDEHLSPDEACGLDRDSWDDVTDDELWLGWLNNGQDEVVGFITIDK